MPLRLKRFYETADLHFITFSCFHREPHLQSSTRKDHFLSVLESVRRRYGFAIIGYVVMPEHVHLLLSKPEAGDLSIVLQVLKQSTSRDSELESKIGGLWQRRFYDFNVRTETKRIKSFATCTKIQSLEDWLRSQRIGSGVVLGITPTANLLW
jgi:putative transposase